MKINIILIILLLGVIYRLFLTAGGSFLFNMDSARDMVAVREMVVLKQLRLSGPGTAIDGLFNGPAWYYLLAIPFIFSKGDPYASIVGQIILWVIGGFYLLKIVSKWSFLLIFPIGFLWIASNYIGLMTSYAFNPNPVALLTPLFVYLLSQYIENKKFIYGALSAFLGGLFFNFEMSFGVFIPLVIILSIFIINRSIFKSIKFYLAFLFYLFCLLPQIIFDYKHNFIMSGAIAAHLNRETKSLIFLNRFEEIKSNFYNVFIPTLFNSKLLSNLILLLSIPVLFKFFKIVKKDSVVIISLLYIFVPFVGFLFLPVTVNPWHLGGPMTAAIILVGFIIKKLGEFNLSAKFISFVLIISILYFSFFNIAKFFIKDRTTLNMDPSLFKNEIAAVDFVYKRAKGANFKVYTYLPSVYDYPYQYLFWWYGKKTYGYIPEEYAYLPNKPKYIPSQDKFQSQKTNMSNLVFLIKEPDRNYTRSGWEGNFINLVPVGKYMVGPIEIEERLMLNK